MKLIKSERTKLVLKIIVSIVLLILIFSFIDLEKFYQELLKANPAFLLLAVVASYFHIWLKAVRWDAISKGMGAHAGLLAMFRYTFISNSFGLVTPARVGEFVKAKYLVDKTNISYSKSVLSIFIDKAFDIVALLFMVLLGLSFIGFDLINSNLFMWLFLLYIVLLVVGSFAFKKSLSLFVFLVPKKYKHKFQDIELTKSIYFTAVFVSIASWLVLGLEAFFILLALGFSESFIYIVMVIVPLLALSSILPISLGGVGVRELVAIYFFSLIGISLEQAALFSLIYTFISIGIPALTGLVLYFEIKKRKK